MDTWERNSPRPAILLSMDGIESHTNLAGSIVVQTEKQENSQSKTIQRSSAPISVISLKKHVTLIPMALDERYRWWLSAVNNLWHFYFQIIQGAIEDLRSILISLQVNSQLDHNSYPTLDPLQREMVTSHCAQTQPTLTEDVSSYSKERRTSSKKKEIRFRDDNRFPSSPVSDFNDNLS